MEINLYEKKIEQIKADLELVIVHNKNELDLPLSTILDEIEFFRNSFNIYLDYKNNKLYLSINSLKSRELRIGFFKVINFLKNKKFRTLKIDILQKSKELKIKDIVTGFILGSYSFDKYKTSKITLNIEEIKVSISQISKKNEYGNNQLKKEMILNKSVNFTRGLVNNPSFEFFPKTMAEVAMNLRNKNIDCKVYGEEEILAEGMNAMFSVGKASVNESQLIHLTYKPKNPKAKIVLVGKGVTYDTGGLSLKKGDSMVTMKCDKAGACTILGIFEALGKLDIPFEIHGVIGAVENMIGGDAYKPDDILKAKNGKTIEVTNTDAEGRLVLADCLCFAQEKIEKIDYIFDFATLTGASIVAFGGYTTAVMGYSEKLKKQIAKASKKSGELVGFLPFNEFLEKRLKSEVADMINTSPNKNGGAITAALFLSKFIEEKNKKKWLHFDIAGPSYRQEEWGINPYGATGVGVRLMFEFLEKVEKVGK